LDLGISVLRLLDRGWRTVATLFCFGVFMSASVLALPLALLLALFAGSRLRRGRIGKTVVRFFFRFFFGLMRWLGCIHLEVRGLERLRGEGLFIVANHPTLIDFVLLAGIVSRADCLVKSSLRSHWALRWPVELADYIPNDRGEETLELCRSSLESGNSIVIFPEGTRTPPGLPLHLKRGAAQLALRCGRALTQVVIDCPSSNLEKGGTWWLAPPKKMRMRVEVLDTEESAAFLARYNGEATLAARALTALLERRFNEVLQRG
jgi:1-acyl-sn-glycerol-3-phosphate acyltransferase